MAKVSVIIPVYKVEHFLEKCIDSVIGQTFQDLEIILVDDGSPDKCGEICDNYARQDKRIRVIHKENKGLPMARNEGILAATSDWILFVDSDDWIEKDYIQMLYDSEAGMYDVSICGAECEFRPGIWKKRYGLEGNTKDITDRTMLDIIWANSMGIKYNPLDNGIKMDIIGPPWNKLYHRKLVLEKGIFFDSECKVNEDMFFNLEYLQWVRKIHICPYYGYHYRCVQDGITKRFDSERIEKDEVVLRKIKEFNKVAKNPYLEEFFNAYICITFTRNLSRYYFSKQNPKKFYKKLKMVKKTLQENMYREAFAKVNRAIFEKYQYLAIYFARKQWVIGLALLTKLNVMRKKLINI